MDRRRKEEVERIFQSALDRPEDERHAFVEREAEEASVRDEVLSLLRHHDEGIELFRFPSASSENLPERIGPFEIVRRLGRGGMGIVYLARQREPVQREVALKLVRGGLDSAELALRFASEQRALAQLEHPNVARLYEAGVTEDGRPWFAMEYVEGPSITRYCDERKLSPDERVALLTEACAGVQEAHQRGIIHRDLKPSNILVTERDGRPVPKIIDFGVAKWIATHEGMKAEFTRHGQLVGTPEYMSPEQAAGRPVDIRGDVYSLGVVLYELLAGALPLDAAAIREQGFEAMMRLILEAEPARPSTRVTTLADADVALRRRTDLRGLARALRGELDWIALRALEKERERRYATVAAFAEDLQSYLDHEPVRARPATFAYQLRKFARRNRRVVVLAAVAVAALAVFAVGMTLQAGRIARERDRANQQTEVAQQVKGFLIDLFESSDPAVAQGDTLTARELLERGVERLDAVQDPRIRYELLETFAEVHASLGEASKALDYYRRAYATGVDLDGPRSRSAAAQLNNIGTVFTALGKAAAADSAYAASLSLWRELGLERDPGAIDALQNRASTQIRLGHFAEAEAQLLHAIERRREVGGDDDPKLFLVQDNLAGLYVHQERFEEARAINEDVLKARRRVLGDDHPQTIASLTDLAWAYTSLDRLEEAQALLEEAVERGRRVLGEAHPSFGAIREKLAYLYFQRGEFAEAEPFFRAALDSALSQRGEEHPNTLTAKNNLGALYAQWGDPERAEPLFLDVLRARQRLLGDEHPSTHFTRYSLALLAAQQGRFEECLSHLRAAIENGFDRRQLLEIDETSDFAPLLGDPEFERLRDLMRERLGGG